MPVCAEVDLERHFGAGVRPEVLRLVETADGDREPVEAIPAQFEPAPGESGRGKIWFLMPPKKSAERRFRLVRGEQPDGTALTVRAGDGGRYYDVFDGQTPVLRYNHGTVPVPDGTDPVYARGDYIHPLFGPNGETLTDDYPKDHPHHRGVSWSWPVTRWGEEVRDIWAVRGVWSRPVEMRRAVGGPVFAVLEAENVWKWGDQDPIVQETVVIRSFRQCAGNRVVDVEVRLTGLVDGVAIGGRPKAGYGGFSLRAAPGEEQKIVLHAAADAADPQGNWIDYSAVFPKGKGRTGIAVYEHPSIVGYPSRLLQYPQLNCVMPAFPGSSEVPLPKSETLVLKYRLWNYVGGAGESELVDVWSAFAAAPEVKLVEP